LQFLASITVRPELYIKPTIEDDQWEKVLHVINGTG